MGISKKTEEGLKALQHTLNVCPHIQEVHFTAAGEHYFQVEELADTDAKGKKMGPTKKYGYLRTEAKVSKIVGERKFYKHASVPTPEAEIVESLTRDEVLDYEFNPEATTEVVKGKGIRKKKAEAGTEVIE